MPLDSMEGALGEAVAECMGGSALPVVGRLTVCPQIARASTRTRYGRNVGYEIEVDWGLAIERPELVRAVVAHEAGHLLLGHVDRRRRQAPVAWATMIAAAALGYRQRGWGRKVGAYVGVNTLVNSLMMPRWRREEFEADRFMADAVGCEEAIALLRHLRESGGRAAEWAGAVTTHPTFRSRIERLAR